MILLTCKIRGRGNYEMYFEICVLWSLLKFNIFITQKCSMILNTYSAYHYWLLVRYIVNHFVTYKS